MEKKEYYKITALSEGTAELYIYGDIGEDFWAEESNDAKTLVEKIKAIVATVIIVRLNTYGGAVSDSWAIFNALRRHGARIITVVDGVCFSAGSTIFMAGDDRQMAANSMLMIHAPLSYSWDALNAKKHREHADMLDKYSDAMISAYRPSGQSDQVIEALLKDGADHYYTAEEALSDGFATEITEAVQIAASAIKWDRYSPPAAWVAANHLNREEKKMPKEQKQTATSDTPAAETTTTTVQAVAESSQPVAAVKDVNEAEVTARALAAEQTRRSNVRAAFEPFKAQDGVQALLDSILDNPKVDASAASEQLLKHLGQGNEPMAGNTSIIMGATAGDKFVEAASNAILARSGNGQRDRSNPFNGATLMDFARAALDLSGIQSRGMDKREVVGAAFTHSTSDFPILLENVMHKTLLTAYATALDTWTRFCKTGDLSDFRPHGRYRTGSFGNLDKKTENNEFKNKSISDALKESITLGTKGNIININREMIINDDLGGFLDLLMQMGRAAKRTVESDVYALLLSNPKMSDGKTLFHADHGNLGTASAVTMAAIEAGRVSMAKQKDIGKNDFLDIRPSIFVGGLSTGGDARMVNDSQYDPEAENKLQKPNKVRGLLNDVVDSPRVSGNQWFLFADPNDAPVLEVGFLDGNQEPYLEMKDGFTQDGVSYKVRLDYAVGAIGYEGAYRNPGE